MAICPIQYMMDLKQILRDEITLDEEVGIYSVHGLPPGDYDNKAAAYDAVIAAPLYNKIMWGNSPSDYLNFAKHSLQQQSLGMVLDVGCGTLTFTAEAYNATSRKIILSDYSLGMMLRGKNRIQADKDNITFLRADGFNLPFHDGTMDTVVSFGVIHVFEDPLPFCKELFRVLKKGGDAHFTSLVKDRWISHQYLKSLHKSGEIGTPKAAKEMATIVERAGFTVKLSRKGGMAYMDCIK